MAVTDVEGVADLAVASDENSGRNTLGAFFSSTTRLERVETVTTNSLDLVVERAGLSGVDVVKIDAEGAEARVIAGSKRLLERFRRSFS